MPWGLFLTVVAQVVVCAVVLFFVSVVAVAAYRSAGGRGQRRGQTMGEVAYSGYFVACGGKSLISGADLPSWDEQAEEIRVAWEAAAEAVVRSVR